MPKRRNTRNITHKCMEYGLRKNRAGARKNRDTEEIVKLDAQIKKYRNLAMGS